MVGLLGTLHNAAARLYIALHGCNQSVQQLGGARNLQVLESLNENERKKREKKREEEEEEEKTREEEEKIERSSSISMLTFDRRP